jgi:hypothetical protein
MELDTVNSKPCSRCGGSGHYSFNLRDGTVCYGCGGVGRVPATPKGQKKNKPTAELKNCKAGDIIDHSKILYRVDRIQWIKLVHRGWDSYNQVVWVIRLVDEKKFKMWRCASRENGESFGYTKIGDEIKYSFGAHPIEPADDMIGQDTDIYYITMTDEERAAAIARWSKYIEKKVP